MMRLIGRLVVVSAALAAVRVSDAPSLPWWADMTLCVGGLLLIGWAAREEERA